jgi:hypothetical protein
MILGETGRCVMQQKCLLRIKSPWYTILYRKVIMSLHFFFHFSNILGKTGELATSNIQGPLNNADDDLHIADRICSVSWKPHVRTLGPEIRKPSRHVMFLRPVL